MSGRIVSFEASLSEPPSVMSIVNGALEQLTNPNGNLAARFPLHDPNSPRVELLVPRNNARSTASNTLLTFKTITLEAVGHLSILDLTFPSRAGSPALSKADRMMVKNLTHGELMM